MAISISTSRVTDLSFVAPRSERASSNLLDSLIHATAAAEHLREHGTQYFPLLKPHFSISMEPIRRSTNPVSRFVLSDGKKIFRVIAKRPPVYPENNEALSEYENYTDFNLSGNEHCGFQCPRVLTLISGSAILLTEEAEGDSLRKLILRPSVMRNPRSMDCLAAVNLSAKWLATFHQLAASTVEPRDVSDHNPLLTVARELDDDIAGVLSRDLAQSLNNWRHSVNGICRNPACRIGRWHGDFGASNIVVGLDRVTVLDAAFRAAGPQLSDVAEFLTYPLVLSCAGMKSTAWYRRLASTFLQGYFGDGTPDRAERSLLRHFCLCALLRSLYRHLNLVYRLPRPARPFALGYLKVAYTRAFSSAFDGATLSASPYESGGPCLQTSLQADHEDLQNRT